MGVRETVHPEVLRRGVQTTYGPMRWISRRTCRTRKLRESTNHRLSTKTPHQDTAPRHRTKTHSPKRRFLVTLPVHPSEESFCIPQGRLVRLSRLLVLFPDRVPNPRDHSLAEKVACLILQDSHRGLPSHMRESVIECVEEFARTGSIAHYWWMCLIAVQARPGDESPETIFLRRELESIFYTLLVDTCP